MKKLIIILLLVLLTGCVKYYSPETAYEDGVYYAEDDPAYVLNSGDYTGVVIYYPWSSLDYFYTGYWPYAGYGYGFAYAYPFGIGYSPWDYPNGYYGFHSPGYFSYRNYPYWRPYRGYCPTYGPCHRFKHGGGKDRYARKGGKRHGRAGDGEEDFLVVDNDDVNDTYASVSRHVSTAPAGYSGNQGMVIRSRESKKSGKSYLQPVSATSSKSVSVKPSPSSTSMRSPASSTRSSYSRSSSARSRSVSSPSRSRSSVSRKSSPRRDLD